MSLATQITALASRVAAEIKTVRAELASGLSGKASTSHTHALDDLTDVVIAAPSNGQAVVFNGTSWVNSTVSSAAADGSITDAKIVSGGLSPNKIAGTAVITTDSRLSDARTPLTHAHAQSDVTGLSTSLAGKASMTTGTSFPSSPVAGQMFVNTTNKCSFIYNGTGWDELSRPNRIEPMLLIGI
jgi:hypothetical protein